MLSGKKVILGVSGSIAAYKSAFLIRLLVTAGAEVKVIMTESAKDFITPLSLATLSKNKVVSGFINSSDSTWNNHVELGLWANLMLIAPASANTIAKMATGLCDSILLATYLSARCPVYYAPAMDLDMLKHPATQSNFAKLKSVNNILIPPADGELASGLFGEGRMAEPEDIITFLEKDLKKKLPLAGKKVMVSAGPTYEAIDPVRFIGNHSSGKMGIALAEAFEAKGASVTLVMGPSTENVTGRSIERINVTSSDEMLMACLQHFKNADIAVLSAAVADYKPSLVAKIKIKKSDREFILKLQPTTDILAKLGKHKTSKQVLIGFALETNSGYENALSKLKRKNLDYIVLNTISNTHTPFKNDFNDITLIDKRNKSINFGLKPKHKLAEALVEHIMLKLDEANALSK